ncbi:hypothetical protein [Candidatus Frankia alpina]|uniref:hypothetical protein n=1 Tax=Candidatus Frankia alpina TaxID=2699483 RepID=UPI001F43E0C0|nr:hypothetical protein [Candidatus Frankia alpina]
MAVMFANMIRRKPTPAGATFPDLPRPPSGHPSPEHLAPAAGQHPTENDYSRAHRRRHTIRTPEFPRYLESPDDPAVETLRGARHRIGPSGRGCVIGLLYIAELNMLSDCFVVAGRGALLDQIATLAPVAGRDDQPRPSR